MNENPRTNKVRNPQARIPGRVQKRCSGALESQEMAGTIEKSAVVVAKRHANKDRNDNTLIHSIGHRRAP